MARETAKGKAAARVVKEGRPYVIVGIDPSIKGTAVCVGDHQSYECRRYPTVKYGGSVEERIYRYEQTISSIKRLLRLRPFIDAIYIEGYAYAAHGPSTFLGEFGGMLRAALLGVGSDVIEISPSTLKKWTTGKGNANKILMARFVKNRWNEEFLTHDEVDAYALYEYGVEDFRDRMANISASLDLPSLR